MTSTNRSAPRRGEIWTAKLGDPPRRHWVVVVSLDARNTSDRVESILIVPFGSTGAEGPTTMKFEPGETGLPSGSFLKGHFNSVMNKSRLLQRLPRALSQSRMREVAAMVRRSFDPDAPWDPDTKRS